MTTTLPPLMEYIQNLADECGLDYPNHDLNEEIYLRKLSIFYLKAQQDQLSEIQKGEKQWQA